MLNSEGRLPGQLHEVSLTKREIEYLKNLVSFELSQMTKAGVSSAYFERQACESILKSLDRVY